MNPLSSSLRAAGSAIWSSMISLKMALSSRTLESLTLTRNSLVPLTDDLAIIVLDQPDLIYYPSGGFYDYGIHEVRGPTYRCQLLHARSFGHL